MGNGFNVSTALDVDPSASLRVNPLLMDVKFGV
jgi:hypothetical protein